MAKKQEQKFEDRMNRLQQIVSLLEKEDIDLDSSIELYKEGLEISKILKDELSAFEDKIKQLNGEDYE